MRCLCWGWWWAWPTRPTASRENSPTATGVWRLRSGNRRPRRSSARGLSWRPACLANPYFEEGAFFPLTLYRKFSVDYDFYSVYIGEFRPPINFLKEQIRRGKPLEGLTNVYLLSETIVWCIAAGEFRAG